MGATETKKSPNSQDAAEWLGGGGRQEARRALSNCESAGQLDKYRFTGGHRVANRVPSSKYDVEQQTWPQESRRASCGQERGD